MFACTYSYSVDFVCSTSYIIVFNSVILMSPVSICLEQCMTSEMFSNLFSCYLVFFLKDALGAGEKLLSNPVVMLLTYTPYTVLCMCITHPSSFLCRNYHKKFCCHFFFRNQFVVKSNLSSCPSCLIFHSVF